MIEVEILNIFCNLPVKSFSEYGFKIKTPNKKNLFFKNNNSNILGIAHLDTVKKPCQLYQNNNIVFHPCLDDRLGVYLLINVLPKYDIKFDLLLTDGEEIGDSTAKFFTPNKKYNWMFSFDRSGIDVVMYQYQEQFLKEILENHGFTVGKGSRSDISVCKCGCKGFNFGTGYYNNHSNDAFANLNETENMVNKFISFYENNKDVEFVHI